MEAKEEKPVVIEVKDIISFVLCGDIIVKFAQNTKVPDKISFASQEYKFEKVKEVKDEFIGDYLKVTYNNIAINKPVVIDSHDIDEILVRFKVKREETDKDKIWLELEDGREFEKIPNRIWLSGHEYKFEEYTGAMRDYEFSTEVSSTARYVKVRK
jgi:hypothetical protein